MHESVGVLPTATRREGEARGPCLLLGVVSVSVITSAEDKTLLCGSLPGAGETGQLAQEGSVGVENLYGGQ